MNFDGKIILWDVMDTLVYDPFNREIPEFFGVSREELIQRKRPGVWEKFELGEIDESRFLKRYFKSGKNIEGDELRKCLKENYRWIDGAVSLLDELADTNYRMHVLSNYPIWYRIIEEKLKLSQYASWSFVSCKTGYRKPNYRAYENVLRTMKVNSKQILFIDDRIENCKSAEEVGIPTYEFDSHKKLRNQLF